MKAAHITILLSEKKITQFYTIEELTRAFKESLTKYDQVQVLTQIPEKTLVAISIMDNNPPLKFYKYFSGRKLNYTTLPDDLNGLFQEIRNIEGIKEAFLSIETIYRIGKKEQYLKVKLF